METSLTGFGAGNPNRLKLIIIWLVLVALTVVGLSAFERWSLQNELVSESEILHRIVSQRADQHDAHLTALSAVASAGEKLRTDLFLDVANTIRRFYPRIASIHLVSLIDDTSVAQATSLNSKDQAELIANAARQSNGSLQLLADPEKPSSYLLVKRSPNTDEARFGLALTIDADELLHTDADFWAQDSVQSGLAAPDGALLAGQKIGNNSAFSKVLGSASQPLILESALNPSWASLFPLRPIFVGIIVLSLTYLLFLSLLGQYLGARSAERVALAGALELRLAHASRVNALGEMASGIAHELTQPLTAILSQLQAGKHLNKRGESGSLSKVLDDAVEQSKRAASILERMRRWTTPQGPSKQLTSLQGSMETIQSLLLPKAKESNISLKFISPPEAVIVNADSVELEQVLFNLVRNAFDAVEDQANPLVDVQLYVEATDALIDVSDNGNGVAPEIRQRLFEPFVTQKSGGTGLGLALSQRLIDHMGGEISLVEDANKTIFRVRLPISNEQKSEAA